MLHHSVERVSFYRHLEKISLFGANTCHGNLATHTSPSAREKRRPCGSADSAGVGMATLAYVKRM